MYGKALVLLLVIINGQRVSILELQRERQRRIYCDAANKLVYNKVEAVLQALIERHGLIH